MAEIRSKAEFFRLWEAGVLGNRLRQFAGPHEAIIRGATFVGFREIGHAGGGSHDVVHVADAQYMANIWDRQGRRYKIGEAAPDDRAQLQGEVCRTIRGLEGYLGVRTGLRMREAMAAGLLLPRSGCTTRALVSRFMDPSSQQDLDDLLDLYPDATIEFTCYDIDLGVIPNRNTIFWEVRNY